MTGPTCEECGRVFDLTDEVDSEEWTYGHDCEDTAVPTDLDRHRRIVAMLRPVHVWALDLVEDERVEFRWAGGSGVNVEVLRYEDGPDRLPITYTAGADYFSLAPVDQSGPTVEEVERAIADYLVERPGLVLDRLEDA